MLSLERIFSLLAALVLTISLAACKHDNGGVDDGDGGTGGDGMVDGDGQVTGDGGVTGDASPTGGCVVTECGGHVLACGDCLDNDGDGLIDSWDPECLGPCDNTEGPELNAGVGGETGGPCKSDCYFDFGNGSGNDDCYWDHRCDPLAVAPDYPPEGEGCEYEPSRVGSADCPDTQSTQCIDYCLPMTPNGCDCFGCCTFDELAGLGPNGENQYVWIGALGTDNEGTCTFATILDSAACPQCTPVADCLNDCGECEICIGMTEEDLPPWCNEEDRCPGGQQACGLATDPACPAGFYCVTGCCLPPVD